MIFFLSERVHVSVLKQQLHVMVELVKLIFIKLSI